MVKSKESVSDTVHSTTLLIYIVSYHKYSRKWQEGLRISKASCKLYKPSFTILEFISAYKSSYPSVFRNPIGRSTFDPTQLKIFKSFLSFFNLSWQVKNHALCPISSIDIAELKTKKTFLTMSLLKFINHLLCCLNMYLNTKNQVNSSVFSCLYQIWKPCNLTG